MIAEQISGAVVAIEVFTDPTLPPNLVEITAETSYNGSAWTASDDDGRYVTKGYSTQHSALLALAAAHIDATTTPTEDRTAGQ